MTDKSPNPASAVRALESAIAKCEAAFSNGNAPGIDALGALVRREADLAAIVKDAKERQKAVMLAAGAPELRGLHFIAKVTETVAATIDTQALRAELPEIAERYTRSTPRVSLTFKPR